MAVREGHLAIVTMLFDRGANVNARVWAETGWTERRASGERRSTWRAEAVTRRW
jgi:hypothetical protein